MEMRRLISAVLAVCMALTLVPSLAFAEDDSVVWPVTRMPELLELEEANGVIYMGTSGERASESGKYIITICRDGNSESEASVSIATVDVSAKIREDYDILSEDIEYYDLGGTVMERNAGTDAMEKVEEYTESVNDISEELAANAAESSAAPQSELAKIKEAETGEKARALSPEGKLMSDKEFLTEIIESYGGAEMTADEYSENSEKLNDSVRENIADYIAVSSASRVTFAPGETEKQIEIKIFGDRESEADEIFTLLLSSPEGAELGGVNTATVTIENDDPKETAYVGFDSESAELTDGCVTVKRYGADYDMVSADMLLESGESKTIYFKPYETEVKVSLDTSGSGRQTVTLQNFKGCEAGDITSCAVSFGASAEGLTLKEIKDAAALPEPDDGIAEAAKKNPPPPPIYDHTYAFYLDNTKDLHAANPGKDPSNEGKEFRLKVYYDPSQFDEDGNLYGKIIDESYAGGAYVGNYYFPKSFEIGLFYGANQWKTCRRSEWRQEGYDDSPNGYIYLEWYDWRTWNNGKSTAKLENIDHEQYGYYAFDWLNEPSRIYSKGWANGLIMVTDNKDADTSHIYKGGKFGRTRTAVTSLVTSINKDGEKEFMPQKVKGSLRVSASDEEKNKTPSPAIRLYGVAAMFRKFKVNIEGSGTMEFKTESGTVRTAPARACLAEGHSLRYFGQDLTVQSFPAGSDGKIYGELIGYRITLNCLNSDLKNRSTFYYMENGRKPSEAGNAVIDEVEEKDIVYADRKASVANIAINKDFVGEIDSRLKGVSSSGTDWTTDIDLMPLYAYKDIEVQIAASSDGAFENYEVGMHSGEYHYGDTLSLAGVPADSRNVFAGVKVEGRATANLNDEKIIDSILESDSGAPISLTLGDKNCKFFVLTPLFKEKSANYISFDNAAKDRVKMLNTLTPEQIKKINEAYPGYNLSEDQLIYICDPGAGGANEAERLINMITPKSGKVYRIQAVGADTGDGRRYVPIYTNDRNFGTNTVGGYTTYITASKEISDNIVKVDAKIPDDERYVQADGSIVGAEYTIRESAEKVRSVPIEGLRVYGPGVLSEMWTKTKDGESVKTLYPEEVSDETNGSGRFNISGIYTLDQKTSYVLYYTNGDIEGTYLVNSKNIESLSSGNAQISFQRTIAESGQTNTIVTENKNGYIESLRNDITTPIFTAGAPYPTNVEYKFANDANNVNYRTSDSDVPILDDILTVSAHVNLKEHKIKQILFTVDKLRGADIEYAVDAKEERQTIFECNFDGNNMRDVFEPGDRLYITLVDEHQREIGFRITDENGNPLNDADGNPIYDSSKEDIKYSKVYSGLSFYSPMTAAVPQSFDVPNSGINLDLPLVGSVMGSGTSGVMTFNMQKWDESVGIDGYSLIFDINAAITPDPDKPTGIDAFKEIKRMKNDANAVANDPANINNNVQNNGWFGKTFGRGPAQKAKDMAYKKSLVDTFGKNEINANIVVMMKFDFAYSEQSGTYILIGAQLAFGGTFNISHTFYTVLYGVPLYLKLTGDITVQLQANVAENKNLTAGNFARYKDLSDALPPTDVGFFILLGGRMDAGVGICGVLGVRGVLKLDITIFISLLHIEKDSGIMASLSGGIGVDLVLFSFDYVPRIGTVGAGRYKEYTGWGDGVNAAADDQETSGILRRLGTGGGGKVGEYTEQVHAAETTDYTIILPDAPERTRPQILTLKDGRKFMVYIGSDNARSEGNRECLYYCVSNEDGTWSDALPVENDGTADSTPDIALCGDRVLITWADSDTVFDGAADEKTMLSNFEISAAVFDGEKISEIFGINNDKALHNSNFMDYAPIICADENGGDGALFYYIKKDLGTAETPEDMIDPSRTYQTIAMAEWDGAEVKQERFMKLSGDPLVMNIDSAVTSIPVNGENHTFSVCAFTLDTDGDISTPEDTDAFLMLNDLTADKPYEPINLCSDYLEDLSPQLTKFDFGDGEELYLTWISRRSASDGEAASSELKTINLSGIIKSADGENAAEIMSDPDYEFDVEKTFMGLGTDFETSLMNYKLLKGGDGNLYILWTDMANSNDGDCSIELYGAVRYQGGTDENSESGWSKAVKITDFANYMPNLAIDEFCAAVGNDGEFSLLSNMYTQDIDENGVPIYSENNLIEFSIDNSARASVELGEDAPVEFADGLPHAGEETEMSFEVKNCGLLKLDGYKAEVKVGGEPFGSFESESVLKGGCSDTVTIGGVMPETIDGDTMIEITLTSGDGMTNDYNATTVPFRSDILFEADPIEQTDDGLLCTLYMLNEGNAPSGDFTLELSRVQAGEGLVGAVTSDSVESIEPNEIVMKNILLDPDTLAPNDFGDMGLAELSVKGLRDGAEIGSDILMLSEDEFANRITINGEIKPLSVREGEMLPLDVEKTPESENSEFSFASENSDIAYVDEYKRLIGVKQGKTKLTVTETTTGSSQEFDVIVTEPDNTPTAPPEATKRPSSGSYGGGGSFSFETAATETPAATIEPTAEPTAEPLAESVDLPFVDVRPDDWFYDSVKYMYENGLMNGAETDLFEPNASVTRGMTAAILGRAEGADAAAEFENAFSDVDTNEYYAPYIAWAADNGIVNGVGDGLFAPDDNVTREQLAAMLYRCAGYKGYDVSGGDADLNAFADSGEIGEYAVPAVRWACGAGIINGNGDGTLTPLAGATRAETAAIFERFLKNN